MKHGFQLRLLRFLIGVYGGPRLLLVESVATQVVHSGGSAVVAGCAHATTLMKLALVDSVDHTLKRLPSLFAAVVVDDKQFQAVGESHQVSQQLQRAIHLFTEHAEEVAGLVVSSKKLEIITNEEMIRTDVRNNKVHADALRTCTRNLGVDYACGGKRTGAKVMAMRAKWFRVKMTFLKKLLRQAGARVARLVKTAALPSLICGSDVTGVPPAQLNEARLIARKICREKTYHR